jgi:ceramide glucosyltransferase
MDWRYLLLVPVFAASLFWPAAAVCVAIFMRRGKVSQANPSSPAFLPFVSVFKPVYGMEKDLRSNLETACRQDYPEYEVIFAIQRRDDPARQTLEEIITGCPRQNARIVVSESVVGHNGKVNNLYNASLAARGDVFVFSDSDMSLEPDYLRNIVAPLVDEKTGISCTLYRARRPRNIFEALELLSYNADFIVSILFTVVTGTATACPGATMAIRREVLEAAGGLKPLGDYLVEDYELGRRVVMKGYLIRFVPHVVKMSVDLVTFGDWWRHQVGWDQKTKAANPSGFFFTLLIRGIPFALLYAIAGAPHGWAVFLGVVGLRIGTAISNGLYLRDRDGMKFIWLLTVRDMLGIFVWLAGLIKRNTSWRGRVFALKNGKMREEGG